MLCHANPSCDRPAIGTVQRRRHTPVLVCSTHVGPWTLAGAQFRPLAAHVNDPLATALLKRAGYFRWGVDAWIHEDDQFTVLSTADAVERAVASVPLMPPQHCACGRELPCFDHRPDARPAAPAETY